MGRNSNNFPQEIYQRKKNTPERRSIYPITDAKENSRKHTIRQTSNLVKGNDIKREAEKAMKRLTMTETGEPGSDKAHEIFK
jgi:hypothetical protein